MSAGGDPSDVRDDEPEGDGPPPGFDPPLDRDFAVPDNPPEPSFGARAYRGSDTSCSAASGLHQEWGYWPRDDREHDREARDHATRDEWYGSKWSQWEGGDAQAWGSAWGDSSRHGDERFGWGRRSSWDATMSTAPGSLSDSGWQPRDADPWVHCQDPWSRGRKDEGGGARQDDRALPHGAPQADGRARRDRGDDHDHARDGGWNPEQRTEKDGIAWSGWSHFGDGGFNAQGARPVSQQTSGRASEKLTVPSFTGEDLDDVGGSARSYLRQVEAWRRMTYLPVSQQGLVLYQNLGGKAWIAAEELSVPRLASNDGVSYLVSWINARFLDLEVARIGRAFSDFFRRLRRKQGQTIREYNSEYDRLHARLREVGCCLPEECAAWLYLDRLSLDEAQELNLLASVGNTYSLHRLQQAAVLHDRGQRKPWESLRGKRTHTAHVTDNGDGDGFEGDESDLEDGVPEDVAVAYATYQSAKDRYKEQSKSRGYQGDRGSSDKPKRATDASRDEKIKLMKSKSFCNSCGKKGHWHKDPECPNNSQAVRDIEMCHHVPAEVFSLRHDGHSLVGITDTACAKSVAGTTWLQSYTNQISEIYQKPELVREDEAFRLELGESITRPST